MSRRLSDAEWSTFLSQVDVRTLGLPPWGGVVDWSGMMILVYIQPASGEVFTTDLTNDTKALQVIGAQPPTYDQDQSVWYYHLPEELLKTIATDAQKAGELIVYTADLVGRTAGALASPIVSSLALPLVVAGIIGLVILKK